MEFVWSIVVVVVVVVVLTLIKKEYIHYAVLKHGWWIVDQYIRKDSLERR